MSERQTDATQKKWLASELHDKLGFSSGAMVSMVATIAETSSNKDAVNQKLISIGIDDKAILSVASELYDRLQAQRQVKRPLDATEAQTAPTAKLLRPSSPQTANKNEPTAISSEDDEAERDAFSARLREREEERTKRPTLSTVEAHQHHDTTIENLPSSILADPRLAAKLPRDEKRKEDSEYMHRLREEARRTYLKDREATQLELVDRQVKDQEWLYKNIAASELEREDLKLQKEAVGIAKKVVEDRDKKDDIDAYVMPASYDEDEEARLAVLSRRYIPDKDKGKPPVSEHELWEKRQTDAAIAKYGSQQHEGDTSNKYDLLDEFGATIEFVSSDMLPAIKLDDRGDSDEDEENTNLSRAEREAKIVARRERKAESLSEERKMLPVFKYREDLLRAIRDYPVLIVVGETGSGKTTQIPQFLHEVGYGDVGIVGCTQPRRVAAMSVAARVATEMGVKLGHEVGYSIRFEDCTSDRTVVKYMTDGMLLREFLGEPDLKSYSAIMVDEAHERTLHTDVLFGLVKDLTRFRTDFKLIISSATLEAEKFSEYFDDAPIFKVPGRRHPVSIYYTKAPEANFIDAAIVTVLQIHLTQPLGDILVFLPGQAEIEDCQEELERRIGGKGSKIGELMILPVYANLPSDMQTRIFEPTPKGARKVVLATNIAETSITIDQIVYVIDPGFVKQNSYNPKTGMEELAIVPCSKAAVNQRAGRAGRVRPGKSFRLYTKWSYEREMEDANIPEILRTNLSNVVLSLKSLGIDDLINFDFMDPPPPETLIKSLELLYGLGALNDQGSLTKLGRRMAEFPMDPQYSKMLVQSSKYECVNEIVTICAMLGLGNSLFYRPKDKQLHADNARRNFNKVGGDHLALLNVYDQWEESGFSVPWCFENYVQHRSLKRARDVRDQLLALLERVEISIDDAPNCSDG
eukprot:GHVN01078096.1.p1 GENE.GHVN01078096.1~~GHVN01078096.1.p1  ORF type:complete len:923 (+),score=166.05 GHVN01078096.1:32-2800(+)